MPGLYPSHAATLYNICIILLWSHIDSTVKVVILDWLGHLILRARKIRWPNQSSMTTFTVLSMCDHKRIMHILYNVAA